MLAIGAGMFFLVGSAFIENVLYNDILCFIATFVNIGIYMLIYGVFTLIFVGRKGLAGAVVTTTTYVDKLPDDVEEVETEEFEYNQTEFIEPQAPVVEEKVCRFCGNRLEPTDKFCDMCGARIVSDGE